MKKRMEKTGIGLGKKGKEREGKGDITDRGRKKNRMSSGDSLDAVWYLKGLNYKLFNISEPHIFIYKI